MASALPAGSLAILSTHPIQYQVPVWQALARDGRVPFEAWYLSDHGTRVTRDREFGREFAWDLGLLEGYRHRFLRVNTGWDMDLRKPHKLRLAEPLGPLFRERNVTHLLVTGWHKLGLWQAVSQARRNGVRVWLRAESNDLAPVPAWKRPLRRAFHQAFFRSVDRFLYIGSANRRLYEKAGVRADRLRPAPYCIDNSRFAAQAAQARPLRGEIRRGWKIPADAYCALFCGKFIGKKRPLDLVAAAAALQHAGGSRRVHLLFVGSGALDTEIRQAVKSAGLGASFPGFLNQTEISAAYVAADCLVLPSDHGETWGLVVNEAMASGLPCIVSDAVGCGEDLVLPVSPRLRFKLGDIQGLATALTEAMGGPPAAADLKNLVAQFDVGATVGAIVNAWREAQDAAGSAAIPIPVQ